MDNNNMGMSQGSGSDTGTRDVTYDLTAVLYHALQGVENCQTYMGDAQGKQEHRQFFQMAIDSQKKLAEQAKILLHDCLMQETGGGQMSGQQQGMDQQQGMSQSGGQSMGSGQGSGDDSAFRFASSETEGGSDQFGQSGQSEDQRYSERSTSGGSSSSF